MLLVELLLGPQLGLDLSAMAPAVQHYFQEGLATSTHRVYSSAMKRFTASYEHLLGN